MLTCQDCVASDLGCCVRVFDEGWKLVLLPSEVGRIWTTTGVAPSEFVDTSPLTSAQLEWYCSTHTAGDFLWSRLFSLWTRPSGIRNACPFVRPDGCSLPYESKPFLCRIYPLSFSITENRIYFPEESDCPIGRGMKSEDGILYYFHDDMERLKRAFAAFREEFVRLVSVLEAQ